MINCNIDNYKEWMEAYLNGDLSREDMLIAEVFLQKNPQLLDQYLLELEELSLTPVNIKLPSKNELKIHIEPTSTIHTENYHEYFIGYYEKTLSNIENKELDLFISFNPKLKREFEVYGSTILVADTSIKFPNKNELLKRTKPAIPLYWSISAAASVLIIFGIWFLWPSNKINNGLSMKMSKDIHWNEPIKIDKLVAGDKNSTKTNVLNSSYRNDKKNPQFSKENLIKYRDHSIPVEVKTNQPVELDVQINNNDLLALQTIPEVDLNSNVSLEEASNSPKKKGLLNKIFSGEKVYIEDYVNATFGAFKNNKKDDDKWVLKVERDNKGRSKKVKFTSPIFSFKTRN